jgi:ABC-type antimicrobial peptide transport system permease subunit
MIWNYFKIAWRNLINSKGYSLINIGGLAIAMAGSGMILLWIQYEVSVDAFHSKSDRIYEVWRNSLEEGTINTWNSTPKPMGPRAKEIYPEIENYGRITEYGKFLISAGEKKFSEEATFTDPGFFEIFSFPNFQGESTLALSDPNTLVITRSLAKKLFGEGEAIGESVTIEGQFDFIVGAVLEDLPSNTNFPFQIFLPWRKLEILGWSDDFWLNNSVRTFMELKPGTYTPEFAEKFKKLTANNSEEKRIEDILHPIKESHLYNRFENGVPVGGRIELIRTFAWIACFILLIACINFMNLSTARSSIRAKEVGIRKVSGANKGMLIVQFLVESLLISLGGFIIALVLIAWITPLFNQLVGKEIPFPFYDFSFWVYSTVYILFAGILAGSYPAFFLSSFSPAKVLKSKVPTQRFGFKPREGLVIFQFTIAIVLISSTWVINNQLLHVQNRDMGLDNSNLIYHPISSDLGKNYTTFRNEVINLPEVEAMSATFSPLTEIWSGTDAMKWQGKEESFRPVISRMSTDADLVQTAGLEITLGRDIDVYSYASDSSAALINASLAKILGFENPIGEIITDGTMDFEIVGVVKDFVMDSPFDPIGPILITGPKHGISVVHIKLTSGGNLANSLAKLEDIFKKFNPQFPFDYQFVEEMHARKFHTHQRTATLTAIFSGLAIFISCLGLFGLATFISEQRGKEISVRKVLGASSLGLMLLLSNQFVRLVLISVVLAIPISYYWMEDWLAAFPYRISIHWKVYLFTGTLALFIATLTVGSQTLKAALINPSKMLKSE